MKSVILILTILIVNLTCFGQKEDLKYASFNILSGAFTSSAIACFHKPKGQTLGKTFINGFWKGAVGGSLNFAGKKLVQQSAINDNLNLVWPARIVNALGSSIIYNGAKNERLLATFNMNVFFLNLSYDKKVHCRVDPYTLGSMIALATDRDLKFDLNSTVITGSIIFKNNNDTSLIYEYTNSKNLGTTGRAYGNAFFYNKVRRLKYRVSEYESEDLTYFKMFRIIEDLSYKTLSHELIHTFQYEQYNNLDIAYINKINWKFLNYLYINPNFGLLHLINNLNGYSNNIFENEADFIGISKYYK